MDHLMKYIKKK